MCNTCTKSDGNIYQLISSPAVFKSENDVFNTVYSILSVRLNGDTAATTLVYDVTRVKSVGEKILSDVIKCAPSQSDIHEFIASLL